MRSFRALGLAGLALSFAAISTATACSLPLAEPSAQLRVSAPSGRAIIARFGMRRHQILGFVRLHPGIDYEGPIGDPIMAAATGYVKTAKRHGEYGNHVEIDHGSGYASAYSHMSGYAVNLKEGDCVEAGTVIGFVGNTGLSTSSHLHFEITRHGVWLDPELFLNR
jgi:murein DD-endopeptidase MepM/ murein hydrolase activator NlpD